MVRNILRGGRRLQWLVMAIVFIFLQLVPLASLTNTVKAATYELASSNGVWTAVNGGQNVTGKDTNEVRWGYSTGMGQSGLRFDGSASQSFEENQKIVLGTLTHFNWPITNAANGATLAITLVFNNPAVAPDPTFTFNFAIDETPNQQPCASWHTGTIPCDDKITFPSSYPTQSFTIGDKLYTLKIEGFTSDSSGTNPVSAFITHEQKDNVAYLIGSLSSVLVERPALSLNEKAVNGDDADDAPGPTLFVGKTANYTYKVQNTGNVELSDIVVNDDKGVAVTCPKTTLAPGELMTCTGTSTVVEGLHTNTAHATGYHPSGTVTSNTEVANYTGVKNEANLTINKTVINDNGGDKQPGDFEIYVNGNTVTSGETKSYTPDKKYEIKETAQAGYELTTVSGDCSREADGKIYVTLTAGQDAVCNLTNNDVPPALKLIKSVINDNGGTASEQSWSLSASGPSSFSGTSGVSSGATFKQGEYTLSESGGPSGYTSNGWACTNGVNVTDGNKINLPLGKQTECTVTNDDDAPTLKLIKELVDNYNSGAEATHWTLTATGPSVVSGTGEVVGNNIKAGNYKLEETSELWNDASYYSSWDCGEGVTMVDKVISIALGQTVTCKVTNTMKPAKLTVKKVVINYAGGTAKATDFTFKVNDGVNVVIPGNFDQTTSDPNLGEKTLELSAGTYSVVEDQENQSGYKTSYSSDCKNVTVNNGQRKTCTITNTAVKPKLTVYKKVINDNGGTKSVSDFKLFVNQETVKSGEAKGLNIGQYTVSESTDPSYKATFSGDCNANGKVNLALGESKTCVITNDDVTPKLTLVKKVINNDGGTKKPSDWTLMALGPTGLTGAGEVTSGDDFKAGTYKLSESVIKGYTSLGWSCTNGIQVVGDQITIQNGQSTVCTVTNDDTPPILVNTGQDTLRTLLLGVGLLMIAFCSWFLVAETVRTKS